MSGNVAGDGRADRGGGTCGEAVGFAGRSLQRESIAIQPKKESIARVLELINIYKTLSYIPCSINKRKNTMSYIRA